MNLQKFALITWDMASLLAEVYKIAAMFYMLLKDLPKFFANELFDCLSKFSTIKIFHSTVASYVLVV